MSLASNDVLAVQFLKITAVVRNNRHSTSGCVFQLFRIRLAQLASVSRSYCLTISLEEQLGHKNMYVLIKVNGNEQFAVQIFLIAG